MKKIAIDINEVVRSYYKQVAKVYYEVYLKKAQESAQWDGMELSSTGSVETHDLKGIVKVYRKDWKMPFTHEVDYDEYVQIKKDNETGKTGPNTFWKNKPKTMIKKVAVSQAFRMCFPKEFDGMPYTSDEIIDQEKVLDVTVESIPSEQKALSSDEILLTDEQLKSLNVIAKKNGYSLKEIKEFIQYTFKLTKIKDLKNKHLLALKKYLSKPRDKINVSAELMEASVEVKNSGDK